MAINAKAHKKALKDSIYDHGLSNPEDRVLEISARLGDAAAGQVIEERVICPSILGNLLFITAAMDNIDHNPAFTSAMRKVCYQFQPEVSTNFQNRF